MKKYQITSESFTGKVEVWYDENGELCYLNFLTAVEITTQIKSVLLRQIPWYMKKLPNVNTISMFKIEEVAA